jgi:hypothetical protein
MRAFLLLRSMFMLPRAQLLALWPLHACMWKAL